MVPTGILTRALTGPLYAALGRAIVCLLPLLGLGFLSLLSLRLTRP